MPEHKPAVKTQTCKGPRVSSAPFCSVYTVLVLCPHLYQTVLQPAALLPLHQMTTGFTGERGKARHHHPGVAARREQQLVMEAVVPDTPDPVVVLQAAVQGGLGLPGVPDNNHSIVASSGQQVLFVRVEIQRPDVSLRGGRMDELPRRRAGPTIPSRHLTSTCCGYFVAISVRVEPE